MKRILNWREVIEDGQHEFFIQNYQRFYEWDKREIKDFINSIKENIYLGSLTFFYKSESPKEIEVIDGQQRLTTLFLIFGDKYKKNFKLNITLSNSEIVNKIIKNEEIASKADRKRIDESSYLTRIQKAKEIAHDEFQKTFGEDGYDDVFEKIFFPMIEIPDKKKINRTFVKHNTSGIKLSSSSIYKAYLVNKFDSETASINEEWFKATDNIYKIISNKYISNPKIDDVFVQAYNSNLKSTKWIAKSKKKFKSDQLHETFSLDFLEYTKWALDNLFKVRTTHKAWIKNPSSLVINTLNGKVIGDSYPLLYRIMKKIEMDDKNKSDIYQYLSLLNNLYVSNDSINKKTYLSALKKIHDYTFEDKIIFEDLKNLILDGIVLMSSEWNGEIKEEFYKKMVFWHGESKSFNPSYKITKTVARVAFAVKSSLFEISSIIKGYTIVEGDEEKKIEGKKIELSELGEIIQRYSLNKTSSLTVEHLLNKDKPNILYLDFCTKVFNNETLKNKTLKQKINEIDKAKEGDIISKDFFRRRHIIKLLEEGESEQ